MSYKSITFILVLYFVFATSGHAGPSGNILRGLKTVAIDVEALSPNPGFRFNFALDPKDPKVVELGKFVIHEENKNAEPQLIFGSVLKAAYGGGGEVQRYALVIGASDGTRGDEYFAYVLVDQDSKELVAFRKKLN